MNSATTSSGASGAPSFGALVRESLAIGCLSFGGAAGQIALMHRRLVEEKRWIGESSFRDALNFCTLLPGPEAQQLATFIGWRLHGIRGGLAAGLLFVLPGAALILVLAQAYALGSEFRLAQGLLLGIKAAVVAILVEALLKMTKRAAGGWPFRAVTAAAFLAMFVLRMPFPYVIAAAAAIGVALAHRVPFGAAGEPTAGEPVRAVAGVALAALALWWAPVALAALVAGPESLLVEVGLFFSKLAVITFGGAYALLAYLTDEAVARGWVLPAQMLDALGLAETTPGPTILVNPFVAFLAGWKTPGGAATAWLAGLMAIWTTFAPSFLWIFAGGPYLDRVVRNRALRGALAGIGAAVVGVIATVGANFALVLVFEGVVRVAAGGVDWPVPAGGPDLRALALVALAFGLLFGRHWPMLRMLGVLALAGLALGLAG